MDEDDILINKLIVGMHYKADIVRIHADSIIRDVELLTEILNKKREE